MAEAAHTELQPWRVSSNQPTLAAETTRHALPRRDFRPDIEGLRACAVLLVIAFHAGMPGISGGFVGVDVFFVMSGFLVTGILIRDIPTSPAAGLVRFYAARARRLLPAACTVITVTALGAVAVLPPLQVREVLGDGVAAAFYAGNYRFAVRGTNYLANTGPASPFQHYWSLGVEEQFYLLWPVLIVTVTWLIRRRHTTITPMPYVVVFASLGSASLMLSLLCTHRLPAWAYFGTPARAWELAAGALVALTASRWQRLGARAAGVAGWSGLVAIAVACTRFGPTTAYPGIAALVPVVGTVLIVAAGCATPARGVGTVLSLRPMRAIGRLSYSWYLWHWPILLAAPRLLGRPFGAADELGAVAVSLVLAILTLRLIEDPLRFTVRLRDHPARSLGWGLALTSVTAALAAAGLIVVPTPIGRGPAANAVAFSVPPASTSALDPLDTTLAQLLDQVHAAVATAQRRTSVPRNLSPSLSDAATDKAAVFVNGCVLSWLDTIAPQCISGDTRSSTTVALIGDSHAGMWYPAFDAAARRRHWRLDIMSKVTCPLMSLPIVSPYLGRPYSECERWRSEVMARMRNEHPRLIVVDMSRRYGRDFGFASYDRAWVDTLGQLVAQLRGTGASVLVLGPIPDPHTIAPTCLSDHLDRAQACSPPQAVAVNAAGIAAETAATTSHGGRYADLTPMFCAAAVCPLMTGNNLVYRDDNHLTATYARVLTPVVAALVDRALAGGR